MIEVTMDKIMNPTADWTEAEWTMFDSWLKSMLKIGEAVVTFTKKDGSTRVMRSTLNAELLPVVEIKEGAEKTERKKSDTTIAVYDLEAKGWRSFATKSVTSVSINV
jgi:hypothetical protein